MAKVSSIFQNSIQQASFSKTDAWTDEALPPVYLEWRREERRILLEHLLDGDYVADYCCGDGRLISAILTRASQYVGCDSDPEPLHRARLTAAQFGERIKLVQCDFKEFRPCDGGMTPTISLCLGNSVGALPYRLSEVLSHMGSSSTREVVVSVIRKGTLSLRRDYYTQLGIPHQYDEATEAITSDVWGASLAFSPEELEDACAMAGCTSFDLCRVGKLGLIISASFNRWAELFKA